MKTNRIELYFYILVFFILFINIAQTIYLNDEVNLRFGVLLLFIIGNTIRIIVLMNKNERLEETIDEIIRENNK